MFEFQIKGEWMPLQGAGGLYGNGVLHAWAGLSFEKRSRVLKRLLTRVQAEAERTGTLRRYRDVEDYRERIKPFAAGPADVTGARYVEGGSARYVTCWELAA